MSHICGFILLICLIKLWSSPFVSAKVYMVLMEEDSVSLYKDKQPASLRNHEDTLLYKERIVNGHDMFLESVLETGSYTKLYSYTHLLNGFALHVTSEEVLKVLENAKGVRIFHEDIKMEKLTTHTPEYLGIPSDVWPTLGGAESSGEQVVIGMIDTGINPNHPSFSTSSSVQTNRIRRHSASRKFRGICQTGKGFTEAACNEKIIGARYFSRGAIAGGDFIAARDYSSPFDADGHGSHTASIAAGNSGVPVIVNGFNYGFASGMAPGAQIAVYKAMYKFGGYMSDVVAAIDQAVEDGVDILNLSLGPSGVPPGPSVFLNVLEMVLLFATKAGVLVVQSVGDAGSESSSILSYSPWITSVAASMTDRKYISSIKLGNGVNFSGTGLAPPTTGEQFFPIAAAKDVCKTNTSSDLLEYCQHPELFIPPLVRGKLIICPYTLSTVYNPVIITAAAETMQKVGAAGFILALEMDPDAGSGSGEVQGTTVTFRIPGIILDNIHASNALREYYNSNTVRNKNGRAVSFTATARILDGRQATYTGNGPIVASYSSRGPVFDNALMQTADVLKPNILAPGSSIWAAWSPNSEEDHYIKGQNFAFVSGTSIATPHIAGVAALIKQKHPQWSPAAITSAMMTTADTANHLGVKILAEFDDGKGFVHLANATPFDYGSGFVHPSQALNPGLVFDISFQNYVQFLCSVPGVDEKWVRRAVGVGCPAKGKTWCPDLNTASVTVSNLVGSRTVLRTVKNVATETERYTVIVQEPMGVSIRVTPKTFSIEPNVSKSLQINLEATEATNAFTFGELLLRGNRKHNVRIPLIVFATSA